MTNVKVKITQEKATNTVKKIHNDVQKAAGQHPGRGTEVTFPKRHSLETAG